MKTISLCIEVISIVGAGILQKKNVTLKTRMERSKEIAFTHNVMLQTAHRQAVPYQCNRLVKQLSCSNRVCIQRGRNLSCVAITVFQNIKF